MAAGGADASGQTSAGLGALDEGLEAATALGVLTLLITATAIALVIAFLYRREKGAF